jgi:DNA (cytosine-5)-methyltransferase 1
MQGIDLFSGAGGMSEGALQCGIDVKYAVEKDIHAAATFALNHKSTSLFNRDIRSVQASDFPKLDRKSSTVLFGGPPCQGFSTSNQTNRNADNEKNWLFKEYLRIARLTRPDWIVFENVKGLAETEGGFFLDSVLKGMKKLGYVTSTFVLNSADYGVPQRRNRLFIVGSLHGINVAEPPKKRKTVTVFDAISDLPDLENGAFSDVLPYGSDRPPAYARKARGRLAACDGHLVTRNAPHIVERYAHIPPGGNWEDIPRRLMENYADVERCHTGIYRRLKWDEPSVVIGNFRKNMLIHPVKNRGLSVREAARLQSFPDRFRFRGSIGFQQQQVGNAVPPALAKALFETILKNHK